MALTEPITEVQVVSDPAAAGVLLDPRQNELLVSLQKEPGSASSLAERFGTSRQQINYHLRELEEKGLTRVVEEKRKRNFIEKIFQPKAASWVIDPSALGALAPRVIHSADRLSAGYLLSVASRIISDLGALIPRAEKAGKRISTLTLDGVVRFSTPTHRDHFARELTSEVYRLIRKYNDPSSAQGRSFRIVLGAYPEVIPTEPEPTGVQYERQQILPSPSLKIPQWRSDRR